MFSDYELFNKMCKKRSICPPPEISEAMKIASNTGELNLPCLSIVMPICEIIGRILTSSTKIKSIDLSDCMLVSQAVSKILDALCQGTNVTKLNLKGNNITGPIVKQLGEIFYHNNTLKYLHLEWNNLGADVESFNHFCKGLCHNYNIEEVDLRYNQITSHCAHALNSVLKSNKSLKVLNLAWNTLGLEGGQLILNGLRENKSIIKLNLRGNCVPDEIIEAVDSCAFANQRKMVGKKADFKINKDDDVILNDKNGQLPVIIDANTVIRHDSTLIKERIGQLRDSEKRVIFQEFRQSNFDHVGLPHEFSSFDVSNDDLNLGNPKTTKFPSRSLRPYSENDVDDDDNHNCFDVSKLNEKINALNKILDERLAAVEFLNNQVTEKNAKIDDTQAENNRLINEIRCLKEKHESSISDKIAEIKNLKDEQKKYEESLKKMQKALDDEINNAEVKNKEWEAIVDRYKKELRKSSLEIMTLKEKWKHKSRHFGNIIEQAKAEIAKLRQKSHEKDSKHRGELNVLKNSLRETTDALEECQTQLLRTREELKDTFNNLSNLKEKCSEYEVINRKYDALKEIFSKLKDEKSLTEEKLVDAQRTVANLQRKVTTLQGELIEPQRRYDLLKDELNQEKERTARLKQEVLEERSKLKDQDAELQKMSKQVMTLNSQINQVQIKCHEELKEHEAEKKMLKEIIESKERDLSNLKAEEAQRASFLYAAFSKYLNFPGPMPSVQ